ncbi:MAG: hypothetical protein QNI84_13310 [Henriciella sp.]|nr:hypothetical protein [Henriciella sp.]
MTARNEHMAWAARFGFGLFCLLAAFSVAFAVSVWIQLASLVAEAPQ